MKKLKQPEIHAKIDSNKRGFDCEQYPVFSFQHLTTNNHYNFEYFSSHDKKSMELAKSELYNKLEEISKTSWKDWIIQNKKLGAEKLTFSRIHFSGQGIKLAPDEPMYIFRFDHQSKRIIGFRKDKCPIYYIIGYDFDHSAYNHGT